LRFPSSALLLLSVEHYTLLQHTQYDLQLGFLDSGVSMMSGVALGKKKKFWLPYYQIFAPRYAEIEDQLTMLYQTQLEA
jgi:hypothetical protein